MTLKEQLRKPLVQQYILEIALPLVGYLFFGWSIAVIISFYFLDYFVSEIARHRRHFKIKTHWNGQNLLFYTALAISVLIFVTAFISAFYILKYEGLVAKVDHIAEIKDFAVDEGWFLLPIIYLAAYMKDVMTFYAPRRYAKYNFKKTIRNYYSEVSIQSILIIGGLFSWSYFQIPEIPALLIFVVIKLCFDQLLAKKLRAKNQK
jgi:hypothetical protein